MKVHSVVTSPLVQIKRIAFMSPHFNLPFGFIESELGVRLISTVSYL